MVVRKVNGYGGGIDDPNVDLEAALDIDMVIGMNPGVRQVLVYEDGEGDPFGTELVNSLSAIASDNLAQTVSISYGLDEALQDPADIQAENVVLQQLVAQGIGVFVSSGDHGAYGDLGQGLNAPDPGAQPLVTSVGGTRLITGKHAAYVSEKVWNDLASNDGATGGGISAVWPIPSYQVMNGRSLAANNGGSSTNRNVPDVAAVADPITGVAVYSGLNGGWIVVGGTSVSAPIWAAYTSIASANAKMLGLGQIGFANPGIYELGPRTPLGGGGYNDIYKGSNGDKALYGVPGFKAGFGYDNVSGWGSPLPDLSNSLALLPLRLNNTTPPPAVTGLHGTTTATDATIDYVPAQGATGYLITAQNPATELFANDQVITQHGRAVVSGLMPDTYYRFVVYSVSPGGLTSSIDLYLKTAAAK